MPRPKGRRVSAGTLTRYRNGICAFTCRHDGCRAWWATEQGWRAARRAARDHATRHAAEAHYRGTPGDISAIDQRPTRKPRCRLATAVMALALAWLAFTVTVAGVTGHAAPAPVSPSIAILPTTLPATATAETEGYVPTPAGPPATDATASGYPRPTQRRWSPAEAPRQHTKGGGDPL